MKHLCLLILSISRTGAGSGYLYHNAATFNVETTISSVGVSPLYHLYIAAPLHLRFYLRLYHRLGGVQDFCGYHRSVDIAIGLAGRLNASGRAFVEPKPNL